MAEIEMAAHAANAHEFLSAMPEGYETMVGERGGGSGRGTTEK